MVLRPDREAARYGVIEIDAGARIRRFLGTPAAVDVPLTALMFAGVHVFEANPRVTEELMRLGARQLVRVGTTGALTANIGLGDLIVASSAAPVDGTVATLMGGRPIAPAADFALTRALVEAAERLGVPHHVGQIATIDVFSHYHPDKHFVDPWRAAGVLAVEMEASVLFHLAASRGVQAACLGVAVDIDSGDENQEHTYLSPEELNAAVERMIDVALAAETD